MYNLFNIFIYLKYPTEYFRVPKHGSDKKIKIYPELNKYDQQVGFQTNMPSRIQYNINTMIVDILY